MYMLINIYEINAANKCGHHSMSLWIKGNRKREKTSLNVSALQRCICTWIEVVPFVFILNVITICMKSIPKWNIILHSFLNIFFKTAIQFYSIWWKDEPTSCDTGSNWPKSWPMVTALGLTVLRMTFSSSFRPLSFRMVSASARTWRTWVLPAKGSPTNMNLEICNRERNSNLSIQRNIRFEDRHIHSDSLYALYKICNRCDMQQLKSCTVKVLIRM